MLTEKLNYLDTIVKNQWYLCPGKTVSIWQDITWAKLWAAEGSILGPHAALGLQDPALTTPCPHRVREATVSASGSRTFMPIPAQVPRAILHRDLKGLRRVARVTIIQGGHGKISVQGSAWAEEPQ